MAESEYVIFSRWLRRRLKRTWSSCGIGVYAGGVAYVDSDAWRDLLAHPIFRRACAERDSRDGIVFEAMRMFSGEVRSKQGSVRGSP